MTKLIHERFFRMALWGAGVWIAASLLRALGILPMAAACHSRARQQPPSAQRLGARQDGPTGFWRDGWSN